MAAPMAAHAYRDAEVVEAARAAGIGEIAARIAEAAKPTVLVALSRDRHSPVSASGRMSSVRRPFSSL
jgi:hypothetical protein